jgi:outer membrane protein OmpA-like peptidoglycan-associated protein
MRSTAQPAPAEIKPSARFPKVLIAGIVIVLLVGVTVTAGVIYVAHRIGRKSAEVQSASNLENRIEHVPAASDSSLSHSANSPTAPAGKPAAPYGWTTDKDGKLVPAPSPFVPISTSAPSAPIVPLAATGDLAHDWALKYERTENSPEADLVVRTGDINNLGFGWPQGFDPFSGQSTPPHPWPNPERIPPGAPDGTDRIMIGSALVPPADYPTHSLILNDGYSGILGRCEGLQPPPLPGQICKQRAESMPQAIRLPVGTLPAKINAVVLQMFVDDFQAPVFRSHFQLSLSGTRIPSFEYAINSLDQTGPIGKLVSLQLLPEYWPLLKSGEVKLLIDDPTTKQGDGYALDFVRILVNPHAFKYQVSLAATVVDADKHIPIPGATVTAALESATTDAHGSCRLSGLPAGLVIATAAAAGYDENSASVDLPAGQNGTVQIPLHRHEEGTAALEKQIAQTGSATIYGIHFDTDSAKLRPDSMPALNAVLGLINNHPGSRWIIAGHTDNQGNASRNQTLSENRAASVIMWLKQQGADSRRLKPQGFGPTHPVADNATPNGRALNRRVEVSLANEGN